VEPLSVWKPYLGNLIDGIHVVKPLDAVQITLVDRVHVFSQETDIGLLVVPGKGIGGFAPVIPDPAGLAELVDQASDLGPGEAGDLDQEIPDQALLGFAEGLIGELAQSVLNPLIGFIPGGYLEIQRAGADQESADLVQSLEALGM
jgi:hypothetical protein